MTQRRHSTQIHPITKSQSWTVRRTGNPAETAPDTAHAATALPWFGNACCAWGVVLKHPKLKHLRRCGVSTVAAKRSKARSIQPTAPEPF